MSASLGARDPLRWLVAVLEYQARRAGASPVREAADRVAAEAPTNRLVGIFPLLDLVAAAVPVGRELDPAVTSLAGSAARAPAPLAQAGRHLRDLPDSERLQLVRAWLDDPSLLDPRLAAWMRIAAGPVLEAAAARVKPPPRGEWSGRACPVCGDLPQCSVIVEESGAFLQGSPRYLVCGRCASWWAFARATCPSCGEDDSRRVAPYVAEQLEGVRVDACDTCRGYVKTFDTRAAAGGDVVPLVDDIATLALDVWAHEIGLHRPTTSLAGV